MIANLNLIRLFRAVAIRGGIKRATMDLHITQSAISQGLAQLERDLGVTLALRSRTEFRLTRAGEQFLTTCETVLADLATATHAIGPDNKALAGEFVIGCDITMARSHFLPRVLALKKQHPKLILHLRPQFTTESVLPDLISGKTDLACVNEVFIPKNADVLTRKMAFSSQVYLWTTASYLKKMRSAPKSPQDFAKLTFVDHDKSLPLYRFFFGKQGTTTPEFSDYIAMGMCATDAVRQGLGVTIGPHYWLADDLKTGKMKLLLPDKYSLKRQDQLCVTRHGSRDPVIRYLWEALTATSL